MSRISTPLHDQISGRPTRAVRAVLVGALVVAILGVAPAAHAAVIARIANGTLTVRGSDASEKIALRRGAPGRLVVDVGDNGTADFTFRRSLFHAVGG